MQPLVMLHAQLRGQWFILSQLRIANDYPQHLHMMPAVADAAALGMAHSGNHSMLQTEKRSNPPPRQ
jgi:hypothetical protein